MKRIFCIVTVAIALAMTAVPSGICQQKTPIYGGVLRIIASQPPQMMSYVPLMSPGDQFNIFPAVERLVDTTVDRQKGGGVEPVLAEKVDEDVKNLKITFHIRKGITFHDGSEFDAEVARWNIQQVLDAKVLPYAKYLKDMKVPDKYTLVINLTQYSNQLMPSWGWWPIMISKAAWDKASGGDLEKGKEWARTHIIGTGPFMLKEYKRDVNLTWVKNPNYWRKGRPYLDGIEV